MRFEEIMNLIRKGKVVSRKVWKGNREIKLNKGFKRGCVPSELTPYIDDPNPIVVEPMLEMKIDGYRYVAYTPNVEDIFAVDWFEVKEHTLRGRKSTITFYDDNEKPKEWFITIPRHNGQSYINSMNLAYENRKRYIETLNQNIDHEIKKALRKEIEDQMANDIIGTEKINLSSMYGQVGKPATGTGKIMPDTNTQNIKEFTIDISKLHDDNNKDDSFSDFKKRLDEYILESTKKGISISSDELTQMILTKRIPTK